MSGAAYGMANSSTDASEFNIVDFIVKAALAKVQTVSIAQVKSVSAAGVTVQILVNLMTGNNTPVPHGEIANRPYFQSQGGANAIIMPPIAGDIGVMVFASRDLSSVIAAKGPANPGSYRQFDWADGLYLGGLAQLNQAASQFIEFLGGSIDVQSPMLQTTGNLSVGTGWTGSFTTPTGNVISVQNGIVINGD